MTSIALPHSDQQPAVSRAALAWLALTDPRNLWHVLSAQPTWLPGICAQVLLLGAASLIAAPAYSDLDRVISGINVSPVQFGRMLGVLLSVVLTVLAGNAVLSGLLWGGFFLAGLRTDFTRALSYSSMVLLPVVLGQALGKTAFALAMPLSQSPAEVLAWHLRPFSAGLASLLPQPPLALSLPWALMACFDLFGLWALLLAASGLRQMFGARREQTVWLILVLVLVFAAGAIGMWQAGQSWLAAMG